MDGHYWTRRSIPEWSEMLILCYNTIDKTLKKLRAEGILIAAKSPHKNDMVLWYRIDYEKLQLALKSLGPRDTQLVFSDDGGIYAEEIDHPYSLGGTKTPEPLPNGAQPLGGIPPTDWGVSIYSSKEEVNLASQPSASPSGKLQNLPPEEKKNTQELLPEDQHPGVTEIRGKFQTHTEGKNSTNLRKNGKKGPTHSAEVVKAVKSSPTPPANSSKVSDMYKLWATEVRRHHPEVKFVAPFTVAQKGQMAHLIKVCGDETGNMLRCVIEKWIGFGKFAAAQTGTTKYPDAPHLGYLVKHVQEGMSFYLNEKEYEEKSVQLIARQVGLSDQSKSPPRESSPVTKDGNGLTACEKGPHAEKSAAPTTNHTQPKKQDEEPYVPMFEIGLNILDDGRVLFIPPSYDRPGNKTKERLDLEFIRYQLYQRGQLPLEKLKALD